MKRSGYVVCILVAAACWGLTGFFNRTLNAFGFSAEQILFVRCLVPAVLLGVWMLARNRAAFRIRLKDAWVFLGSGLLSVTMFGLAYMNALQQMNISIAVVLLYTSPIWVVVLSALFFKDAITPRKIGALVCVAAGAVLTTGMLSGTLSVTPFGLLLGLVSGLGYGLYSIFTRFAYNKGYGPMTVTFYTFVLSAVAVGVVADVPGIAAAMLNGGVEGAAASASPGVVAAWQLALGVVTCLIPYVLYTKGLEGVENGKATVLATLEVVVSTLVSVLVYAEPFTWGNLAGMLLVIGGICMMNIERR